jgi:hypothetical protein
MVQKSSALTIADFKVIIIKKETMKTFFYEILVEPFIEKDYFIGILFWCLTILVAAMIFIPTVYFIDSTGGSIKRDNGIVVDKRFIPAHSTTIISMVGKVSVPTTVYHPDSWRITFRTPDGSDSPNVTREFYQSAKEGDRYRVEYSHGRLSDKIYIKNIIQ